MSSKSFYVVNKRSDADEFDRALDNIESRMKTAVAHIAADPQQLVITPEELRKIVTAAVSDAIGRYEVARNRNAELARASQSPRLVPNMERLQNEMGLGDLDLEEVDPAPVAVVELADEAKGFVYQDPTDAALSAWDDALKKLSEG